MRIPYYLAGILSLWALAAGASEHTQARLVLNVESARPGDSIIAGVHLRMDPEWHTYWKNPGASGIATTVKWTLPQGIEAGEIQWPTPKKMPPDDFATFVYEDEVVLLIPLTLASNVEPGTVELKARADWLECKESCLNGGADLAVKLTIGNETRLSAAAGLIETWRNKIPNPTAQAWWEGPPKGDTRALIIEWASLGASGLEFFPYASGGAEAGASTEASPAGPGKVRIRTEVRRFKSAWPTQLSGVLVQKVGDRQFAQEVVFALSGDARPPAAAASTQVETSVVADASLAARPDPKPLWLMLIYAFVGGLILNVMPCVLPVIALKIVGFVNDARRNPAQVRKLGFIYGLGVLVSFLALAGVVLAVKAAGHQAGWGMQFSNPYFLLAMTTLVTLIALNLFGVFEINLGGRAMSAASSLSAKRGAAGAFFNGLLATVLATSCTAPLLGAAVGFAFAQPPGIIVLVLLTVGLGLAFPYVVLSCQPAWLRLLPKPGPWMERFKVAMGFPMLAAALWLCSLLSTHYGERTWALAMFLVVLAVAAWIFGQFVQRGTRYRGLAVASAVLLCAAGYAYALESRLQWREPIGDADGSGYVARGLDLAPSGYDWQPWSLNAIAAARAEGRPVIVDFTAKWCPTCNLNVKPVLASDSVRETMTRLNAAAFLADYTRRPSAMTDELKRYDRAGVPLVLVYPADPSAPPIVLPEVLTPGMVLDALEKAAS